MAYLSGTITSADPATELILALESVLDAHSGNWEFVETVPISSINYRVWKNRGTGVTNPNSWGSDFHFAISRQTALEVRITAFEAWDATNKKAIRPCRASGVVSTPNANFSFGDETNGFILNAFGTSTTSLSNIGANGLATTGFSWYCQATKDRIYLGLRQGVTDDALTLGVFESLLTTSPTEVFPLYMGGNGSTTTGNIVSGRMAWSRHPGAALASSFNNFVGHPPTGPMLPRMGGINAAASVDRFHNSSWLTPRPLVSSFGGTATDGAVLGYYRGLIYDAVVLNDNGTTTRNGDTVTISGDVYVKMAGNTWTHWIKRDAI